MEEALAVGPDQGDGNNDGDNGGLDDGTNDASDRQLGGCDENEDYMTRSYTDGDGDHLVHLKILRPCVRQLIMLNSHLSHLLGLSSNHLWRIYDKVG